MEARKTKQTEHKKAYDNQYKRENKLSIAFRLSKLYEAELIEIYQSIPDKAGWFKQCLREYREHHK